MPCAATAMPSPTCSEDRRHKRVQVSASAASMRSRAAKSPAAWTGCRQTCAAPPVKCARRPRLIVSASSESTIPSMNRSLPPSASSAGKALTKPAVEIIRQHHVTRQFRPSAAPSRVRRSRSLAAGARRRRWNGHRAAFPAHEGWDQPYPVAEVSQAPCRQSTMNGRCSILRPALGFGRSNARWYALCRFEGGQDG
jgi:hypothetical protein